MNAVRRTTRLTAHVIVMEVKLYGALARWILRRKPGQVDGIEPVGYARLLSPMLGLWIFASGVETVMFHVITPGEPVRLVLDIIGLGDWPGRSG